MRVEVAAKVGEAETAQEERQLQTTHKTIDALRHQVSAKRCGDPRAVDDYVVWQAIREGGTTEVRTVYDTPEIFRALTPRRVELVEYLVRNDVPSIKDLAAKLRRDYKNTYDDLVALGAWGLVALRREGKNRRPVSRVASLRLELV